jgi:hypothetical protein
MAAAADKADLGDRFILLESIMLTVRQGTAFLEGMANEGKKPSQVDQGKIRWFTYSINWDPAFTNANCWVDRFVAGARLTDRQRRTQEMGAIDHELNQLKHQVGTIGWIEKSLLGSRRRGELIGNAIITLLMPLFAKIRSATERSEQEETNLRLAFALAAYQRDQGHYPAKLDELAPKYLTEIPADLFSGKPLIYHREDKGYLLYSVGVNGLDEGGHGGDDNPKGDDLTVRVPVRRPREKN